MNDFKKNQETIKPPTLTGAVPPHATGIVPKVPSPGSRSLKVLSRMLGGLDNALNRTLNFLAPLPHPPAAIQQPVYPRPTFPAPTSVGTTFATKKDILTWLNLVNKSNGAETVCGVLGFTTAQGDVYIAETLAPADNEHDSSFAGTVHLANPKLEELCRWYFAAWQLWQAQGKVPKDVNFNFVGFGHSHPPGVNTLSMTDIQTIHNALNKGMSVFVAPLFIMDYASEPVITSPAPNILRVSTVQELTIKMFTGVNGDAQKPSHSFRPRESNIVLIERIPYNIPPTSWHVKALYQLVELQTYLKRYETTLSWIFSSDLNADLPYVDISVSQEAWKNDILIRTKHDFPRSAPIVQIMSNDPAHWGTFTTVTGVWNGSSSILHIIDKIIEKGLI